MEMEDMNHLHMITALFAGFPVTLSSPSSAFAQWGPGYGGMHSSWGGMMGGTGWIGMIIHLFIWVLLLIALILIVKWLFQSIGSKEQGETQKGQPDRALNILKERYARGEIDREEFDQKKQDLS